MCGIAGIVFKSTVNPERLRIFENWVKKHQFNRGPDDFRAMQVTSSIYFFHNRLSIIDVANAIQPMEDERGVLTYNGEIYNYKELKSSEQSYRFNSDTEVLLKGLGEQGVEFLKKTVSMFAFGYYDKRRHQLLLARDHIGIKPLYYIDNEEVFAFASTMAPLLLFSKRQLNVKAIYKYYLNRAFAAPDTIFLDIFALEAGNYLHLDCDNYAMLSQNAWWRPQQLSIENYTENEAIAYLDFLLQKSVRQHLESDVPVGIYLSGGVDSGLIAAIAHQYSDIRAFTLAMPSKKLDESPYAKKLCNYHKINLHTIELTEKDFINNLDNWIFSQGAVVADPSALALYVLSQHVKQHGYRVMLSGEGADELLGGYGSYQRFLLAKKLHPYFIPMIPLFKCLDIFLKNNPYLSYLNRQVFFGAKFSGNAVIFPPHYLTLLIKQKNICASPPGATSLHEALLLDMMDRLPNDILCRTDRATMAASIEARVPFLHHELINFARTLPASLLISRGQGKYILKKLAEKYMPLENIYRKKVGFDTPVSVWLREGLRERFMYLLENSVQQDIINIDFMKDLYQRHLQLKGDYGSQLWAFFCLELNYRHLQQLPSAGMVERVEVIC